MARSSFGWTRATDRGACAARTTAGLRPWPAGVGLGCCRVHPVSTALFLVGYGLALPIATRLPTVVANQSRLAVWGHQLGLLIVVIGWVLRGGVLMAVLHLAWMALVAVWFGFAPLVRRRPSD